MALLGTAGELAGIVRPCHERKIPFALRGNGSSVIGLMLNPGVVIDTAPMKGISVDRDTWSARVEPGVTAWELEEALRPLGLRANVAEPSAMVVANIICTGIFSTFSAAYGNAADSVLDGEFVCPDGELFRLTDPDVIEQCEPVYEIHKGWKTETSGITDYDSLPGAARKYLARISAIMDCPIRLVSVGVQRDQIINCGSEF